MTCSLLPGLALRDGTLRAAPQVGELVDLRWEQVDFNHAVLQVRRGKKGTPATHPIIGDEMRALRRLQREQAPMSPFVFTSERGSPFTTAGFAHMLERAGEAAELALKVQPAHAAARLWLSAGEHGRWAGLEAELLTDVQQRLALLSRDMDNHNGQRVLHQPTFPGG
jgi:integrase